MSDPERRRQAAHGPASLDLYRPLKRSALVVLAFFGAGIAGYEIIGYPEQGLLDALYMTVITLTTVGYGEVIDLSSSPGGKTFTILLLLGSFGSLAYFFSNLTAFLVEGELQHMFWRRRMSRSIEGLSDHVIVCGAGFTGEHVVRELLATKRTYVLVDSDEERVRALSEKLGGDLLAVIGDAGDDEVLREAGVERASGLISCVSSDKDNLIVVVSARLLNSSLRIISRCIDERVEAKIRRAGADGIVSPNRIGGLRLISELVRPDAVSYLDAMLRDGEDALRVEAVAIGESGRLTGETVGALRGQHVPGLTILALRAPDGGWHYAPADDHPLEFGWKLVFVGPPETRQGLESLLAG